ncbi:MAG: LuxR C-terminal-related transcriptional regulator [Nakamurella sp.]
MLIGRDAELRLIDRLLAGAKVGQGGVLVITGEAGVGKTALLEGAEADVAVLRAVGSESERDIPFGGLSQLVRPALGPLELIPAPQAEALGSALALRPGRAADRFAVGAATLSLLCRWAEDRPVVVLIDDLHLWYRPSAEAIAFAAHRLSADPVAILATARSSELTAVERDLPHLPLTGLDEQAAAEMVNARSPDRLPPEVMSRLHRATAGNPLALLELAAEPDRLIRLDPHSPLPVSETVSRAFSDRVLRLSAPARAALVVLAVVSGDLRVTGAVCAALGLHADRLVDAELADLIEIGQDRAEFRHPLVRSAVYADADPHLRRRVHRAVAATLPVGDVDRRAWHAAEGALGPDSDVADLLEQAALRAHARSAHAVAATAWERSARLSPDPGRGAVRFLASAESAVSAGAIDLALEMIDAADAVVALSTRLRVRALRLRGSIAVRAGDPAQARDLLVRAAAEADTPDLEVVLLAEVVYAIFYLGDARTAVQVAQRIEDLASATPWVQALAGTAAGLARVLANAGGADELRRSVAQLALVGDPDDATQLSFRLTGLLFLRDAESQREAHELIDAARTRAAVATLPQMLFLMARDDATSDRWTRSAATYAEGIRLARETGHTTDLAMSLAGLGWLLSRRGEPADSAVCERELATICARSDIPVARVWSLFAAGESDLASGRTSEAVETFTSLNTLLAELHLDDPDLCAGPELTEALMRNGQAAIAATVAADFQLSVTAKGWPWVLARALRARGMCADDDGMDPLFTAALTEHGATLDSYEEARTRLVYGERLRRARRRSDARVQLGTAMEIFDRLGAQAWADRAASELAATGAQVRRADQPRSASLTPQELQVALLLAEGRTTRQVAAALFLSPKTVEYHLRKIYTKLDIRTRAALATAVSR